jgi:hypothetical protein
VTTTSPATGGSDAETIQSIRYNAPRTYSSQNRAVTVEDYKALIYKLYPEAESVNVWGGENNIPKTYGKVFLSIKPKTTAILTDVEKQYIISEILKQKNVVSITPEIVDPEYINLEVNTTAYYNSRLTTKSPEELKSLVIETIKAYNTENLQSFTGVFRFSNLSSQIDSTEDSIISNITTIKLHREVEVKYNTKSNYIVYLGNPIYNSGIPEDSITSTGFYIQGEPDKLMFIEDLPTVGSDIGQLRMYYYNANVKTYYIPYNKFGSVDYTSGTIKMSALEIVGIDQTNGLSVFELIIKPQSNDAVSIRNQLVTIPDANITVTMVLDKISIGNPAGGANYVFTSSRN